MRGVWSVGVVLLLSGCAFTQPGSDEGKQTWTIRVEPADGTPWAVRVPALVASPEATDESRAELAKLYEAGDPPVTPEGTWLRLQGEGDLVWQAERSVRGTEGQRAAFMQWTIDEPNVTREAGPQLTVFWEVAFATGRGHACGSTWSGVAHVSGDENARLDSARGDPDLPWPTLCA